MRSSLMEKMESLLNIWIEDQNQRRMPLSQMVIQKKALTLFEDLKEDYPLSSSESAEEFDASRDWFDRFKIRGNLHSIALKGESASADTSAAEKFKLELKAIIEEGGYSAQQVLNADETGLFWKRLPGRTYISKSEKSSPGYKSSKDRLTLLLGGNAAGDFKFKPFLIYHSENPRAFKNVKRSELSVHRRANKIAWMTASLFRDWMNNCAAPELKAYCSSKNIEFKMLLLVDNAPGHPVFSDDYSENINVIFMPQIQHL
ncbi:tigger transposable element-derived protein 1-like [Lucilia sericata]|uniref:tigger transposable element-derived protein 1-like n=1 Tax=Lucilia sericata TaxID=13632 RepID=UPI0018A84AC7|nr:tigger transposable element-derived protein 1-like [Lucilia sericata]